MLLTGRGELIGRNPDCDLTTEDESVSRMHARVLRQDDGVWAVEDFDSTNGTFVDGERVPPGVAVALRDEATLTLGLNIEVRFRAPHGSSRGDVRRQVEADEYPLPRRAYLLAALRRALRDGDPIFVAAFDIDEFQEIRLRHDDIESDSILRRYAEALGHEARLHPCFEFVGAIENDTLGVLLRGAEWAEVGPWVEAVRARLVASAPEVPGTLPVSAALVDARGIDGRGLDPEVVLARATHKLLQAKLAGGRRSAVSAVVPRWHRSHERSWMQSLTTATSVAVATADRQGTSDPAVQKRVLLALSTAIDQLPPRANVEIAWQGDGNAWLVSSDVPVPPLEAVLRDLMRREGFRLVMHRGGDGAAGWVSEVRSQLRGRVVPEADRHWALEQLERELNYAKDGGDRFNLATKALESSLRLAVMTMISTAIWERYAHGFPRPSGTLERQLAIDPPSGPGGYVRWGHALFELIGASTVPPALARVFGDPSSVSKLREVSERRNRGRHGALSEQWESDAANVVFARVREIFDALSGSNLRMAEVVEALGIPRSPGQTRARLAWLTASPSPPAWEVVPAIVTPGVWAKLGQKWIPLSPLVSFERGGDGDLARDIYVAPGFPRRADRVRLVGTVYGADVERDVETEVWEDFTDFHRAVERVRGAQEAAADFGRDEPTLMTSRDEIMAAVQGVDPATVTWPGLPAVRPTERPRGE